MSSLLSTSKAIPWETEMEYSAALVDTAVQSF